MCREDSVQGAHAKAEKASGAGVHVGYSLPASIFQTECCLRNSCFLSLPSWKLACTQAGLKARCKQGESSVATHQHACTYSVISVESCSAKPCALCLPS